MTLIPAAAEKECPVPDPAGHAPFPGPEWEEEDDLSVEWDEDWAWDGDAAWEDEAAQPAMNSAERAGIAP